jgi:hypothetical protein
MKADLQGGCAAGSQEGASSPWHFVSRPLPHTDSYLLVCTLLLPSCNLQLTCRFLVEAIYNNFEVESAW